MATWVRPQDVTLPERIALAPSPTPVTTTPTPPSPDEEAHDDGPPWHQAASPAALDGIPTAGTCPPSQQPDEQDVIFEKFFDYGSFERSSTSTSSSSDSSAAPESGNLLEGVTTEDLEKTLAQYGIKWGG